MSSAPGGVPHPAVFLSYAREDAAAARRLAEALRAGGVDVGFDENERRGGDEWDQAIRAQIRDCTLFLPIISDGTQQRHEEYLRLEWHLAAQRSLLMATGQPWIAPVCIDDTPEGGAAVPEAFLAVPWMRVRDGETAVALVERVKKMLADGGAPASSRHSGEAGKMPALPQTSCPHIPDYEMLRVIGRGSYGDVWLARGITGIYRAIKVVWRDRFADAGPYEREFKGLKEFAAISLGESIQMALLHIGRSDDAGYFYYVMELADDADRGREIVPASYVSLTLTEARKRRGRLPAAECVGIGVELARVLAGLHKRGLIHRDIKPSNIIFVGGVAKLADIGLVTPAGDASTFVGTEGFVPPEGPGSPSADVFALGKLIYELATGHDRQEFPKLPADVRRLPDSKTLFELNEIIIRACERDAAKRYADGVAFLADLLALQAGSSLRARRVGKNLLRWAAMIAMAAILVGGGFVWWKGRPPVAAAPEASLPRPAAATAADNSIAVLPFSNLSGDPAQEYFSDGITQEMLGALRRERDLTVPGDMSCFAFKGRSVTAAEIGKALNVARLIEGSVRRSGNQVRISVTLTRVADGFGEEVGTFTEELSNIFALQEKLAHAVVAKLTKREPATGYVVGTTNPEAYDLYLRGRSLQTGGLTPTAGGDMVKTFEKVVALDPNYALAWARLAQAYSRMRFGGRDTSTKNATDARNAAATALRLAPNLAEAHLAMARIHYTYDSDLDATERELDAVDRLGPNDAEALALRAAVKRARGHRGDDLVQLIARSAERDPQNSDTLVSLGNMLGQMGRFAEAHRLYERARALADIGIYRRPQAMNWVKWTGDAAGAGKFLDETPEGSFDTVLLGRDRAKMREMVGDFAGAITDYERLRPLEAARGNVVIPDGRFDLMVARLEARLGHAARAKELRAKWLFTQQGLAKKEPDSTRFASTLAFAHALLGEKTDARTWMAKWLEAPVQNQTRRQLEKAELLTLLGDKEAAIAALRVLHDNGHFFGYLLRLELEWEPLRGDPKFQQLMKDAEAIANAQPRPPAGLTEGEKWSQGQKERRAADATEAKSVAVLAFKNVGGDPVNVAIVEGIALELISVLGRVPELTVRGNSSLSYFKGSDATAQEKGRQLDVTYLVDGSLQRAGDTVRIAANLTRAATNEIVWSSTPLTRDVRNIFAVQEEIVGLIAQALSLKLGAHFAAATAPVNPQAFEFYWQARQALNLRTLEGFARAEDLLNRALGLERNFARAHAALADVWLQRESSNARLVAFSQRNSPVQIRIVAKIREALALDPNSAEAHASLGLALGHQWQSEASVQELRQAIALNPNYANAHHWLGRALAVEGRMDEAIMALKRAAELDPFAPTILDNYAWFLCFAGRHREAEAFIERVEILQPNLAQAARRRVALLLQQGRNTAAVAVARAITPTNQTAVISKIFALADVGLKTEAEALLPELTEESWLPNALAAIGRHEESIAAFTEARLTRLSLNLFFYERACDPIRDDPRLRRLLAVVGATEAHARAQAWRQAHSPEKREAKK